MQIVLFWGLGQALLTVQTVFALYRVGAAGISVDINRGSEHTDQREASHKNLLKCPPGLALTWAFRIHQIRGFRTRLIP